MPMPVKRLRLLFMGTPAFAAQSLRVLAGSGHEIISVVTAPDRPKGRGLALSESEVKKTALELGLPLLQPVDLKDPAFMAALKSLAPDLIVIVAFRILPMEVVEFPPMGTINLHASLLPAYRGAAPIQWAVANGESETGLTVFFLNKVVDGGGIIRQAKVPIGPDETGGGLYDKLKVLGAGVLSGAIDDIASGVVSPITQDESRVSKAPKLKKEHGKIDFAKSARETYNLIRAMTPVPGAYALLKGKSMVITRAQLLDQDAGLEPGRIIKAGKEGIEVQAGGGAIRILALKPESRKEMAVGEFLNGCRLDTNDRFE